MKLLILIQGTLHPEYFLLDTASRITWQQYQDDDVQILPYYGCTDLDGNYLSPLNRGAIPRNGKFCYDEKFNMLIYGGRDYVKNFPKSGYLNGNFTPDIDPRSNRWVETLEYCLENLNFDFVYRTCDSYYVDVKKLKLLLLNNFVGKKRIYTGSVFAATEGKPSLYYKPFVAGSNVLLSRDTVEVLVENKEKYLEISNVEPEDTATGKLLIEHTNYIDIDQQPAYNFSPQVSYQETLPYEKLKLSSEANKVIYKVYNHKNYNDIKRFMKIHNMIANNYL